MGSAQLQGPRQLRTRQVVDRRRRNRDLLPRHAARDLLRHPWSGRTLRHGDEGRSLAPDRGREAARPRPRIRAKAQPSARSLVRRGADLPHRSLPRQGHRPERARAEVLELAFRAGVEPQPGRDNPHHRGRGGGHRHPRRLLRPHRRCSRHDPEPRPSAACARDDGAAHHLRRRLHPAREACSAACNVAAGSEPGRARAVRGIPR